MDKIISNYVKYKFLFKEDIKHSSYLYQKVFRSIYGYTQNVTKKDKKTYLYHREGIIENTPYIRPGKNSIILPINTEHKLINFFNTGKSTTHNFKEKGDWSIDYTIERVEINTIDIIKATENYLNYLQIRSIEGNNKKLYEELNKLINDSEYLSKYKKANKDHLLNKLKHILEIDWINKTKENSEKINLFITNSNKIKELFLNGTPSKETSIEATNKDNNSI